MTPSEAELPKHVSDSVKKAYAAYREAYAASPLSATHQAKATRVANLLLAARAAGWTADHMAAICGVSTRRLHTIATKYGTEPASSPRFPRGPLLHTHLTTDQARELRDLAPQVQRTRGLRSSNPDDARASARFTNLLSSHRDRGVSWPELSAATRRWARWPISANARPSGGISTNGLQARVARWRDNH